MSKFTPINKSEAVEMLQLLAASPYIGSHAKTRLTILSISESIKRLGFGVAPICEDEQTDDCQGSALIKQAVMA